MRFIPEFFKEKLINEYGNDTFVEIEEELKKRRKTTFRVNTIKSTSDEIEKVLESKGLPFSKVDWYKDAFILDEANEMDLQELDIYKDGKIYIQSLSSMIPPLVLDPKENEDILDMTAAPGGKTTEMAALSDNKAHITACEMNKIRIEKLKYNVDMQGAKGIFIMQKDSRQIDDFFKFDKILLDSPCSGSGTLLLNDEEEKYFTEELVSKSVKSQMQLLKKAFRILKKGGCIVYSTCSILKEENEEIIKNALNGQRYEIEEITIKDIPMLPTTINGTLCVKPSELYEGFFVSKIKKV